MKSKAWRSRLASALMAGVVGTAATLAPGAQNAVSTTYNVNFNAGNCGFNDGCVFFSGNVYPQGVGGEVIGDFVAGVFDVASGNAFVVFCTGPQYASALSVNAGGAASVHITIDPNAPGCGSNVFFGTASVVTVNVTGHADGKSQTSITGTEIDKFNDGTGTVTIRLNTQSDCYSEAFTGTVVTPIAVGNLQGNACVQHRIQL